MNTVESSTDIEKNQSTIDQETTSPLHACSPVNGFHPSSSSIPKSKIRRPRRDEPFTTVAEPTQVACIVEQRKDNWGNPAGEEYYPVIGDLQNQVGKGLRTVAFHPCVSASGEGFIYPQKLDPPQAWANSWNASLAQALSLPPGQWRTVWSDKDAECYQHDLVTPPLEGIPEYPGFQEDLEQALTPNVIADLDHIVVQHILGQQDSVTDLEEIY